MILSAILAVSENYGIGYQNTLPWGHIKRDMEWFKFHTKGKPIVMGSSTWDSLPMKPLPYRKNVVLTNRESVPEGADMTLKGSPVAVHNMLHYYFRDQEVFLIGGAKVYEDFWPHVKRLYLTRIQQVVQADTYFRVDDKMAADAVGEYQGWKLTSREHHYDPEAITFEIWDKQ